MSGGVDSAAVASAAARCAEEGLPRPLAYSTVFPNDPELDESERIDLLTTQLGLPSVQIEPEPVGAIWLSLDYLRRFGLPLAGSGYVIEYPSAPKSRRGRRRRRDRRSRRRRAVRHSLVPPCRPGTTAEVRREHPDRTTLPRCPQPTTMEPAAAQILGARRARRRHAPTLPSERFAGRRGAEQYAPSWLTARSAQELFDTSDPWSWKQGHGTPLWWRNHSYLLTTSREEIEIYDYLRHRASSCGLEARPPLFDVDLVELALSIPPRFGFDPYLDRSLVRAGMKGNVPDPVRLSTKKSNLSPFYHRILAGADLKPLRVLLTNNDLALGPYVDRADVARLVTEPPAIGEAGWAEWIGQVWTLATTESWLRYEADPATLDALAGHPDLKPPSWRIHRAPYRAPRRAGSDRSQALTLTALQRQLSTFIHLAPVGAPPTLRLTGRGGVNQIDQTGASDGARREEGCARVHQARGQGLRRPARI